MRLGRQKCFWRTNPIRKTKERVGKIYEEKEHCSPHLRSPAGSKPDCRWRVPCFCHRSSRRTGRRPQAGHGRRLCRGSGCPKWRHRRRKHCRGRNTRYRGRNPKNAGAGKARGSGPCRTGFARWRRIRNSGPCRIGFARWRRVRNSRPCRSRSWAAWRDREEAWTVWRGSAKGRAGNPFRHTAKRRWDHLSGWCALQRLLYGQRRGTLLRGRRAANARNRYRSGRDPVLQLPNGENGSAPKQGHVYGRKGLYRLLHRHRWDIIPSCKRAGRTKNRHCQHRDPVL